MTVATNCSSNCSSSQTFSDIPQGHLVALWLINAVGGIIGSIGNAVLLIFIITHFRRILAHFHSILLSLTASCLLVSLVLQPCRANVINPFFHIDIPRDLGNIVSILSYFSFLFGILAISLERLISICKPQQYSTFVTRSSVICTLLVIWVVSIVTAIFLYELEKRKIFDKVALIVFSLVFVCLLIIYAPIFYILRKDQALYTTAQHKHTKSAAAAVAVLIILWLPTLVYLYVVESFWAGDREELNTFLVGEYLISLHLWNISFNWYIYSWNNPNFKTFIGKLCCCKINRHDYQEDDRTQNINLESF